jgi:hypothetical protein
LKPLGPTATGIGLPSGTVADPHGMPGMHRHTLQFRQLQVHVYVFRGKKINIHVKLSKPNQAATVF